MKLLKSKEYWDNSESLQDALALVEKNRPDKFEDEKLFSKIQLIRVNSNLDFIEELLEEITLPR